MLEPYDDETIAACRSVMLEVLTILGKQRRHLVVIGGWGPPLVFGAADHIGSIDVDLAVDWRRLPAHVYETIRAELEGHDYHRKPGDPEGRFWRRVQRGTRSVEIKVDFLTGSSAAADAATHRRLQGIALWCARGVEIALDHWISTKLSGTLPGGGENTVNVQVASPAALVVMKGIALAERLKEKDAYDLYYCFSRHPGGVRGLAEELRPLLGEPSAGEALRCIDEKFATIDAVGPVWAAQVAAEAGQDYEQVRRDAFERARALLNETGFAAG